MPRFTNLESEHQRAMERATMEETKILELEEELRVVGSNLQQLEVSEEKALEREEAYQRQIRELFKRFALKPQRKIPLDIFIREKHLNTLTSVTCQPTSRGPIISLL